MSGLAVALAVILSANPATPAFMRIGGGSFTFNADTVVVLETARAEELAPAVRLAFDGLPVQPRLARHAGGAPERGAIYAGVHDTHPAFSHRDLADLARIEKPAPGTCRLVIRRDWIIVSGADAAGVRNGLQRLRALMQEHGKELPATDETLAPRLAWRGVVFTRTPSREELVQLAREQCNLAIFDVPGFLALDAAGAARWREVFEQARALGIEPVPAVSLFAGNAPLLAREPRAAEGVLREETLTLLGEQFVPLARPNVIMSETSPVLVYTGTRQYVPGVDFGVEPAITAPPFRADNGIWYVYRIPGGAIPDGAAVSVAYAHVPPGTEALCPRAPETETVLRAGLRALFEALRPRWLFADHGVVSRLNEDLRCGGGRTQSDAAAFALAASLLDRLAKEQDAGARLLLGADGLHPHAGGHPRDLSGAGASLPEDTVLCFRTPAAVATSPRAGRAWLDAADTLRRGYVVAAPPNPRSAHVLAARAGLLQGIAVDAGDQPGNAAAETLRAAAGPPAGGAWPGGLSDFFDADLWQPSHEEQLAAMVRYLDRQSLAGVPPEKCQEEFTRQHGALSKELPHAVSELDHAAALFQNLTRYLALEAALAAGERDAALRDVEAVVRAQAALDPAFAEERLTRILDTVKRERLFVPASILFGVPLLPYRSAAAVTPRPVYEAPVDPVFTDKTGEVVAEIGFGAPAPLVRVDYVTVGTTSLTLAYDMGAGFRDMEPRQDASGHVRGPLLLRQPITVERIRLTARSGGPRAVLREIRVFAHKPEARIGAGQTAAGFLRLDAPAFAAAGTAASVKRDGDALVVHFTAHEPRMHAMHAESTGRDAPLLDEESVELRLRVAGRDTYVFRVNPLGAQYDERRGDAAWDGEWTALVTRNADSWEAVLRVPHAVTGGQPAEVNFLRRRHNVVTKESAWAVHPSGCAPAYGALVY